MFARPQSPQFLLLLAAFLGIFTPSHTATAAATTKNTDFIAGADISDFAYFQSIGARYMDHGQREDVLTILKNHHINCVRLRLFTSTDQEAQQSPYDSINNLKYTLPLPRAASQLHIPWILDFHYSDSWADSAHQEKPKAWANLSFAQLENRMYEYNRDCMIAFRRANALPAYVQVGNEITSGMVWPDGATDTEGHWVRLGRLIKAAARGIRDGAGPHGPKIIIHVSSGDDWESIQAFFDHLHDLGVEYDVIGLSYYPDASSKLDDLKTALTNTAGRYGRPIIIVETTFPWSQTSSDANAGQPILGITPGPKGQAQYIETLCRTLKNIPNGLGAGMIWWGTEYESVGRLDLDGYENSSMFDHAGNLLPAIDTLARFASNHPPARKPE